VCQFLYNLSGLMRVSPFGMTATSGRVVPALVDGVYVHGVLCGMRIGRGNHIGENQLQLH
jgi:hypothetical protein